NDVSAHSSLVFSGCVGAVRAAHVLSGAKLTKNLEYLACRQQKPPFSSSAARKRPCRLTFFLLLVTGASLSAMSHPISPPENQFH
ncbi:MAG: hypothetical protein IJ808_08015, partial [Muribaculaceae bacterium]|nr:hypothetical protein [Muribaculaceae bacterium]